MDFWPTVSYKTYLRPRVRNVPHEVFLSKATGDRAWQQTPFKVHRGMQINVVVAKCGKRSHSMIWFPGALAKLLVLWHLRCYMATCHTAPCTCHSLFLCHNQLFKIVRCVGELIWYLWALMHSCCVIASYDVAQQTLYSPVSWRGALLLWKYGFLPKLSLCCFHGDASLKLSLQRRQLYLANLLISPN